jgi:hypothetical protein
MVNQTTIFYQLASPKDKMHFAKLVSASNNANTSFSAIKHFTLSFEQNWW